MARTRGRRQPVEKWAGPTRPYDLLKEFVVALLALSVLTVGAAAVFSSPDEKGVTIAEWARAAPHDFVMTTVSELSGSSGSAGYGPPYNDGSTGQKIFPVSLAKIAGVRVPIDAANDFVVTPLHSVAVPGSDLDKAITAWASATADERASWTDSYSKAADSATYDPTTGQPALSTGTYGPVQAMVSELLSMARGGGLDGALATEMGFYNTDYTRQMLFLGDGSYLEDRATAQHLGGDQWGMMNEVGNYPGQAWLWLYTVWYQVPPFKTSGNADALIWGMMMVLTLLFVFLPFVPGLRDLPKKLKVYRIIWREHYRSQQ